MAAGPALEMWSRQDASDSSPDGRKLIANVTRAFSVTLDPDDAPEVALSAADLPGLYELYPGTLFVNVKKRTIQRVSPILAVVQCDYSGEIGGAGSPGGGGLSSSPVDNLPVIGWKTVYTDEPVDEDFEGNPLVNANGEPYQGLQLKICDDLLTIERNFLTVNRKLLQPYRMATNSDTFPPGPNGFAPGTGRIVEESSDAVYVGGVIGYWRVRVGILFRYPYRTLPEDAWALRVPHRGLLVRNPFDLSEAPSRAWDKDKNPVTRPVNLSLDGTQEFDTDVVIFQTFTMLDRLPFSALGLL